MKDLCGIDLAERAQGNVHALPGACRGSDLHVLAVLHTRGAPGLLGDHVHPHLGGVLRPDVHVQLGQAFAGGVDIVKLKALVGEGVAFEHLVRGDGGIGQHLRLAPVGQVKTCGGGVPGCIAVERDHIGSCGCGRSRCGGGAFCKRWPLIKPHIIHRHFISEVPAWHRPAISPAYGHVQDDVHGVVKRPVGFRGGAWFFVLVVGVVVVAVHTKADVVLGPPHLVGVEFRHWAAQGDALFDLGVAISPG